MRAVFKIFFVFLWISNFTVQAQSNFQNLRFNNITSDDGLSQNTISCVMQDSKGILWFGTADGLNRYDGYHFKVYKNELGNKNSLSNNYVLTLMEDSKGFIWIGTFGDGLNRFNPDTEEFVRFEHVPGDSKSIPNNDIRSIYEDKDGKIWLAFFGSYLGYYDPKSKTFKNFVLDKKIYKYPTLRIFHIIPDKNQGFWLCTEAGLFYFDKEKRTYTKKTAIKELHKSGVRYKAIYYGVFDKKQPHILWLCTFNYGLLKYNTTTGEVVKQWGKNKDKPNQLQSNSVWSFYQDRLGNYWVGSQEGFYLFDPKKEEFLPFTHDINNRNSISGNNIQKIFEDRAGTIWLGSFDRGLSSFNPYLKNFVHYSKIEPDNINRINAFTEDQAGNIWIGMGRGEIGLTRWNRQQNEFKLFEYDRNYVPNKVATNVVSKLLTDVEDGSIWIGTIGHGLDNYNPKTGKFTHLPHKSDDSLGQTLRIPHVGALFQDKTKPDIIWIGTRGAGVYLYNKKTKKMIRHYERSFRRRNNMISQNTVIAIVKDYKENIWIATRGGLNRLEPKKDKFTNYLHDPNDINSLRNNYVISLHIDDQNILWIGTRNGLDYLELEKVYQGTTKFEHLTTKDGLPNNVIHEIIEDRQGNLWLSTNKGLSLFDKQKRTFKNFDEKDGLQSKEFATGSGYITKDGSVLFGGPNGFNLFYPEKIKANNYKPSVLITDFQIFNQSVTVTNTGILTRPIWATDTLELSYRDNVISFEFAALNYILPEKNTYSIKMENFDKSWRNIGRKHFETYTSLPAGTYIFRVKAANNEGIQSDKETKLVIIVHPPWWETWWFRISVILFITLSLIVAYRLRINAIKAQKRLLKRQVDERTSELKETNEELHQTNEELQTTLHQVKEKNILIQEFNENITESINYAKIIQNDMLPPLKEIKYYLPESFIFYQPRDVVSGDFYWFTSLNNPQSEPDALNDTISKDDNYGIFSTKNSGKVIMVAGDCTGHGVPGAFMSIKGAVLLNQIVKLQNITSPEAILTELDHNIKFSLNQDNTSNRDGMDIGILLIDFENQLIEFAGAKNTLFFIKEGQLYEIKGNMLPVGGYHEYARDFTKTSIPMEPDTNYYLTTDGFTDQFGGPRGKKLLRSRFKSLLLDMHHLPMQEQYKVIEKTYLDWKQDLEQVDDILVVGINI